MKRKHVSIVASVFFILVLMVGLVSTQLVRALSAQQATNLALNKPVTCSPAPQFPCAEAVDGNATATRWASAQGVDPQWIYVDLGATTSISSVKLIWEAAYATAFQIQTSNDATTWTNVYSTTTGTGGTQTLAVSGSGRYVRMNGTARATAYGYSLWEFEIYGGVAPTNTITKTLTKTNTPGTSLPLTATLTRTNTAFVPTSTVTRTNTAFVATSTLTRTVTPTSGVGCGTTNVALGKTATASSVLGGNTAAMAVDGNVTGTRWESVHAVDPQWMQIDLGSTQSICRAKLTWETAYGSAYQIQTSPDAVTWTNIYTTTTGDGGVDDLTGLSGSGRYIRMNGTVRATVWGYSLWEFEVYVGTSGPTPTRTPTVTASVTCGCGITSTPTRTLTPTVTKTVTATATKTATVTATPTQSSVTWTTLWNEDFTGAANTGPSAANWLYEVGSGYGTGEIETTTNSLSNVSLDGAGHLKITALRDGAGAWTSGRIKTSRSDFAANAGELVKLSAMLQQPNVPNGAGGMGYWPAFWALGSPFLTGGTWPSVGELDMMENVNGRDEMAAGFHCGTNPGGVCNEGSGRGSGLATCIGCKTGYHEYSVVLDRTKTDEELRWYLDGQQVWIVRQSQVGVTQWNDATHHGFYMILNVAIGGAFPNAVAGYDTPTSQTVSGGFMLVDSVTVSKATGSVPTALTEPGVPAGPSIVRVTGTQGNWQLTVNGSPWFVKGITWGPSQNAGDAFMRDLQAMGVNTIRTWGVDDANTPLLLNSAAKYGIKVIMGHWLNQGADYLNDATYKANTKTEIINRINALKGYQGLLMWDIGNEVLLTTQDHTYPNGATVEQERVAYAQYIEELTVAIHAADANHPVTSTDAWTGAWPYYKNNSPSLDLYAVNSYGAIGTIKAAWQAGGYTKPFILTEGGPDGEWEVPNDANGVPTEPTDVQKRDMYAASWATVTAFPGVWLGGTEFHYGLENDFGSVWLGTFSGGWHRLGYYSLRTAFGGQPYTNTPPVITSMTVSNATGVQAGSQFNVSVAISDPNGDPIRYYVGLSPKYINNSTSIQGAIYTQTGNGTFTVTAPQQMGVWKIYVYAFDAQGNVAMETRSVKVIPPVVAGTNIAIGKVTTASASQADADGICCQPAFATDGNFSNRWATPWTDPQWIQVDLGSTQTITHIQLAWETAYGKAYQIQTSPDAVNWTTIYTTTTGDGGFDDIDVSGSGRYVRMYATARGTAWGYSLWEFGIYH